MLWLWIDYGCLRPLRITARIRVKKRFCYLGCIKPNIRLSISACCSTNSVSFSDMVPQQQQKNRKLLENAIDCVFSQPFGQQFPEGFRNPEVDTCSQVSANRYHICLFPKIFILHTRKSVLSTWYLFRKDWHSRLVFSHLMEKLHQLQTELSWIAPEYSMKYSGN